MRYMLSCLLLISASAFAQDVNMKPGLWEHSMEFTSESGRLEQAFDQVRQQLQSMPAEQRQMMEQMLQQQGMNLDFANQTFENCLSEEEARKGDFNMSENDDCETTDVDTSGDKTTMSFTCDGSDYQSEGTITVSDTHYSGESKATVDMQGQPEKMTINHKGEWLGDDCGDLAQ